MLATPVVQVSKWHKENIKDFSPPICNKLLHRNQLSVMFVGGPNTRTDFHCEQGAEFFLMLKGNMSLPTIQQGKKKIVKINEGEVFLLPSRIPHSPQRPEKDSLGLVVERKRRPGEIECLRWFTDFEKCDTVLFQEYFYCADLGKDLVKVVENFKKSDSFKTNKPAEDYSARTVPFQDDLLSLVPEPFRLDDFIFNNWRKIQAGKRVKLFEDTHPDKEFRIELFGGGIRNFTIEGIPDIEILIFQIQGLGQINDARLIAGSVVVIHAGKSFVVESKSDDSVSMLVLQIPGGVVNFSSI